MPQLTQFPFLPPDDPQRGVDLLIKLCQDLPADGEPLKAFRARCRELGLWDADRIGDTLRFLRMALGDQIVPSPLMRLIGTAERTKDARELLIARMWEANPILLKTVLERLDAEGVYPPGELYTLLDSSAYPGVQMPRVQLEAWMWLARGLDLLKIVGIAIGIGPRGQEFLAETRQLKISEYLAEDEPEQEPEPIWLATPPPVDEPPETAAPAVGANPGPALTGRVEVPAAIRPGQEYPSPRGRHGAVPVPGLPGDQPFPEPLLEETTRQIGAWWHEQSAGPSSPELAEFGIDHDRWMENPEECLFRLAVAAALLFRMSHDRGRILAAFAALDRAGVLSDLYYGNAPAVLPDDLDPRALMLASLIARRCAEAPELEATLERQDSAAAAFETLAATLGRGLFKMELFWMMRGLHELGALRFDDLADYTALPHRLVRDTLFRLGFLTTPYAPDRASLVRAATATRRLAGGVPRADEVVVAFATAAGCAYDCPHRNECEYACRERAEL